MCLPLTRCETQNDAALRDELGAVFLTRAVADWLNDLSAAGIDTARNDDIAHIPERRLSARARAYRQ